jgi:hypothetical protein
MQRVPCLPKHRLGVVRACIQRIGRDGLSHSRYPYAHRNSERHPSLELCPRAKQGKSVETPNYKVCARVRIAKRFICIVIECFGRGGGFPELCGTYVCSRQFIFYFYFLVSWGSVRLVCQPLFGLLCQHRMMMIGEYEAVSGTIGKGNRSSRRNPAAVPPCQPQNPHDLTQARTWASSDFPPEL